MSRMATARIPDEIYDQGTQRLEELGIGTTDLVRAAFNYLLATGELPNPPVKQKSVRKMTVQHKKELAAKMAASRLTITLPSNWDYKKELEKGKWADYEALA